MKIAYVYDAVYPWIRGEAETQWYGMVSYESIGVFH